MKRIEGAKSNADDVRHIRDEVTGDVHWPRELEAITSAPGYEVSTFDRFRHQIRGSLKGTKAHNGYIHIGLMIDGYQKWMLAHRVVAMEFLENQKDHPGVNHIDGNRENNRVDNLEWASRSHNARDMWARKKGHA